MLAPVRNYLAHLHFYFHMVLCRWQVTAHQSVWMCRLYRTGWYTICQAVHSIDSVPCYAQLLPLPSPPSSFPCRADCLLLTFYTFAHTLGMCIDMRDISPYSFTNCKCSSHVQRWNLGELMSFRRRQKAIAQHDPTNRLMVLRTCQAYRWNSTVQYYFFGL